MTLTLGMITTDTPDVLALSRWWAEQTGAEVSENHGDDYIVIKGGALPVLLAFQQVDDSTPGKNRLHLDLMADDLDAEVDRLLGVGATLVERRGDENFRWVTLADPAGNEFCVAQSDVANATL